MYNVFSNDYASIAITRWGDTNAAQFVVSSFNIGGTAIEGTDYTPPAPVTINPGDLTDYSYVYPLINGQLPVDTNNLPYTGNKTITASVPTGSGYTGSTNTALLTIIDDAYPTATYLYYDPLTNSADTNWDIRSVNDNMQTNAIDEYIDFAYDLYDDPRDPEVIADSQPGEVPIPFPPNGATNALRLTVNKSQPEGQGAAGGVNLYLTNAFFSGNYAVRFNMNLIEGFNGLYTTEGAIFGINHTGQATNWFTGSGIRSGWDPNETEGWEADGIWCWVSVDDGIGNFAGGPSAYLVFTGNGGTNNNSGFAVPLIANVSAASEANNFKSSVFTSPSIPGEAPGGPGLAANASPDSTSPSEDTSWSDVELKQYDNVVTISIDKAILCVYTNKTVWTNGYLMLGYEDPYDSVGGGDAAVYYSNIRAVRLTAPAISEFAPQGTNYVFDFTTTDGDLTPSSFQVVWASVINGPYTVVPGATITQLGNGAFQAVVPKSGAIRFYRIQQPL